MSALDELDFVDALRPGSDNQHERRYLDFTVGGRPLRELLRVGDAITPFGWLRPETEAEYVRQLLLRQPSELSSGRVPFYICPECADLGCQAITARVVEDADTFTWLDFGWETNYQEVPPTEFLDGRPFTFDKHAYEAALRRFWRRPPLVAV